MEILTEVIKFIFGVGILLVIGYPIVLAQQINNKILYGKVVKNMASHIKDK